ncbi:MAG: heparan-alpha-glucosaminide N-acetyltransferase domain-containing protein [Promethearchaeota archaeon]
MRRFASIDFLRGIAIVLMIFLHTILHVLDIEGLEAQMDNIGLINIVAFIVLPFLGGLAGFFLMVSAIGNMISMYRHLQAGRSVRDLVIRQIMGGVLLLIFAMISESILGIHGAIANLMQSLNDVSAWDWSPILYRSYHFETIHTIAWCIILNGIIQGILSRKDGWKNPKKVIKIYLILIIAVVVLTPLMWWLVDLAIPGYPFAVGVLNPITGDNLSVQYPFLGISEWWKFITDFFFSAIAGREEPIFPYLAVSFMGSIIGVVLAQNREDVQKKWSFLPKRTMQIGFIMFVIGAIGLTVNLLLMLDTMDVPGTMAFYTRLSAHRDWVPENGVPILGWFFQFMCLNGAAICLIIVIVRVVEFRGRGKKFADKTRFFRRFGFVAFTMYNLQWIYYVVWFFVSTFIYGNSYLHLDWAGTFLTMIITFLILHGLLLLWEKAKYTGSLEWIMGTISAKIIPARKVEGKWWQTGQLNVEEAFYNAEWLNVLEINEINYERKADSRFAYKMSFFGFLFFPISFITFIIARNSIKQEHENKYNKRGKLISLIGIIFFLAWVVLTIIFSLSDLGISL